MNTSSLPRATAFDAEGRTARWPDWLPFALLALACFAYRLLYVSSHDFDLFVDEAQYWLWSRQLEWGYYSKPPLVAWLIRASTTLFGDAEVAIRLPALLAYPLAGMAIAALAWRMSGRRAAFAAAAVFLTMPGQALSGWILSPDAFLLLAWSLALWQFHRALAGNHAAWLWLGLALGLGVLAKYSMLVFVVGMGIVLLQRRHRHHLRYQGPWTALGIMLVLLAPNLWWNAQHQFETVQHTAGLAASSSAGWWHPRHLAEFLAAQWGIFGLLAFPLWGYATWKGRRDEDTRFLLPFVLPYLLAMCLLALFANANPN